MTRTQVHVALALLRKVLPDVASIELSGANGQAIAIEVIRFSDAQIIDIAPQPSALIETDISPDNVDSDE